MSNLNLLDCADQGILLDINLPLDITNLTNEQLAYEIEKADKSGTHSWEDVKAELKRDYGI